MSSFLSENATALKIGFIQAFEWKGHRISSSFVGGQKMPIINTTDLEKQISLGSRRRFYSSDRSEREQERARSGVQLTLTARSDICRAQRLTSNSLLIGRRGGDV